ncbi:hypothetical protein ABIB37_001668 [Agrococcus sp. UYP10]|uniref:hypothetical protein n=1 Tax=Agrococcus sp. UYP10 TaxID=1756355 RepID=UPI00339896D0
MIDPSTIATTLLGSAVSSSMQSRDAGALADRDVRQDASARLLEQLERVRTMLFHARWQREPLLWMQTMYEVIGELDRVCPQLPRGMQHLGRSVCHAVGEAIGAPAMARTDREMWTEPLAPYDPLWNGHAVAYIDGVMDAIAQWRSTSGRRSRNFKLRDFDDWLRATGRYAPV